MKTEKRQDDKAINKDLVVIQCPQSPHARKNMAFNVQKCPNYKICVSTSVEAGLYDYMII